MKREIFMRAYLFETCSSHSFGVDYVAENCALMLPQVLAANCFLSSYGRDFGADSMHADSH